MNTPLISIIIPLYNTEKYIEKAIESVINQTYKNWQLIIIDDCSTDSSLDIVLDIRKRNGFSNKKMVIKRIKKNMGTYVALNIGLKLAKGNYFCVLGSDDIYIPEKLQIQVDEFTQNPNCICVVGKYIRKNTHGNICHDINVSSERMENGIMGECTSMYSMSLINKIGYYDCVRYGADTNFFWRMCKYFGNYDKIKKINKILYLAIQRPNRLTKDSTIPNRIIYCSNFKKWLSQGNYYIDFPLEKRPYNVPEDMLP
jgi:glycosyltransferase involved in cell wall biosynthesis